MFSCREAMLAVAMLGAFAAGNTVLRALRDDDPENDEEPEAATA